MGEYEHLEHGDIFPASFVAAIQQLIGDISHGWYWQVTADNQITFYPIDDVASISINGRWAYRTTNLVVAHPGGASNLFYIWAYCSAVEKSNTPSPDTDATDYNWYISLRPIADGPPTGNTPAGKPITQSRVIGAGNWNGTKIIDVRMSTPSPPTSPGWHESIDPDIAAFIAAAPTGGKAFVARIAGETIDRAWISPDGVVYAADTGYRFADDTDTGVYSPNSNEVGLIAGGVGGLLVSSTLVRLYQALRVPDGTVIQGNDSDSGVYINGSTVSLRADGIPRVVSDANGLGFFNTAGQTKKTGYGAGAQVGTKGALTSASTLNDVIGVLSSLVADLRTYGLIGS